MDKGGGVKPVPSVTKKFKSENVTHGNHSQMGATAGSLGSQKGFK